MSIEALAVVMNFTVGQPTRKLILMGYANHAAKDGTAAWPGVDTVAEYAECDRRTAQRHIPALLDDGFIREGDQRLVAHLPADRRPIVYDVAMTEEVRQQWRANRAPGGLRADAAAKGAIRRGDKMSPRASNASGQVNRGDNLTPRGHDDPDGVTSQTERGDMCVTQTVHPPTEEPSEGQNHEVADATSLDADVIDIDAAKGKRAKVVRDPRVEAVYPVAREIVTAYMDWWKRDRGMPDGVPLPDGTRDFQALVGARPRPENCQYVTQALLKGYARDQIALALSRWAAPKGGRKPQGLKPSTGAWTESLAAVAAGREDQGRSRRTAAYSDKKWDEDPSGGWGADALLSADQ